MGSSDLTKLFDKLNLDDSCELSVLSEVDEDYNGTGTWIIPLSDMKNKKCLESQQFYIGNADYCKFYILLNYEETKSNDKPIDFSSLILKFVQTLPYGSHLKGDISFVNKNGIMFDSEQFSSTGEDSKELLFTKTDGFFAMTKDLRRFSSNGNLLLEWSLKVKIGSISWESENRNFSLKKRYDFSTSKKTLFEEKCFSDVTFRIHGGEVTAHRSILSLNNSTFQLLFSSVPSERNYFKFKNIDKAPLEQMLQFIYSGDIPKLDFTLASLLYVAAHNYKVTDLKNICSSYLGANLTLKNVFVAMSSAHKCEDIALKEICIEFIKKCNSNLLAKESVHVTK